MVHAHGALRASVPAAGAQLKVAPANIRLTFNEAVTVGVSHIELIGPAGPVGVGALSTPAGTPRLLMVTVSGRWVAGVHTVRWQVAGRDGHPVRGEFTFTLLPEAIPPAAAATPPPPAAPAQLPLSAPTDDPGEIGSPGFVAIRWLTFGVILVSLGVVGFRVRVVGSLPAHASGEARTRAMRIGRWAALAAVALAVVRLRAQLLAFGGDHVELDLARGLLVGTAWGWGWALQVVGASVLWWTLRSARHTGAGQGLATVGVLMLALSPALSGHAAAVGWGTILVDWGHVVGAGGWLGTLLVVLAAGIPATRRLGADEQGAAVRGMVLNFSRLALVCAGLVAATGAFNGWRSVGSWDRLISSPYGRVLLLKIAVLSVVGATGAWNWRIVTPRLGTPGGTLQLRRAATVEVVVAAIVLLVTAVLVATPPPMEGSDMATVAESSPSR